MYILTIESLSESGKTGVTDSSIIKVESFVELAEAGTRFDQIISDCEDQVLSDASVEVYQDMQLSDIILDIKQLTADGGEECSMIWHVTTTDRNFKSDAVVFKAMLYACSYTKSLYWNRVTNLELHLRKTMYVLEVPTPASSSLPVHFMYGACKRKRDSVDDGDCKRKCDTVNGCAINATVVEAPLPAKWPKVNSNPSTVINVTPPTVIASNNVTTDIEEVNNSSSSDESVSVSDEEDQQSTSSSESTESLEHDETATD